MCNYAVIDFEMCRVPKARRTKDYPYRNEIIQVGVVLLNSEFTIVDEFKSYVSPDNGFVDSFIYSLTGISNKNVVGAPKLLEVLRDLIKWLPSDTVFVEWSDNDKKQLLLEIKSKHLSENEFAFLLKEWIDCQELFGNNLGGGKLYNLTEALNISNIYYDDGAHDALVDARNTAKLFHKIKTEPVLQLNPNYIKEESSFCLGVSLASFIV